MQFKLNSKPKKFIKIEDSHVKEKDLNENEYKKFLLSFIDFLLRTSGYYAYQEVSQDIIDLSDGDISTLQTITTIQTAEPTQGFNLNIPTGTFQPKGKQEERQFPSVEYGSGAFPIPILNTKSEPNLMNRGIGMSYEESLFESMINPSFPLDQQRRTTLKKINLKPLQNQKTKQKIVVFGGDEEEDAIIVE